MPPTPALALPADLANQVNRAQQQTDFLMQYHLQLVLALVSQLVPADYRAAMNKAIEDADAEYGGEFDQRDPGERYAEIIKNFDQRFGVTLPIKVAIATATETMVQLGMIQLKKPGEPEPTKSVIIGG